MRFSFSFYSVILSYTWLFCCSCTTCCSSLVPILIIFKSYHFKVSSFHSSENANVTQFVYCLSSRRSLTGVFTYHCLWPPPLRLNDKRDIPVVYMMYGKSCERFFSLSYFFFFSSCHTRINQMKCEVFPLLSFQKTNGHGFLPMHKSLAVTESRV